jgi:hypothetical protein
MSHYDEDPGMCRVDFFRPSGKWYTTVAVKFRDENWKGDGGVGPHEALRNALRDTGTMLKGMTAICLEPYHELSYPISLVWEG